MKKYTTLLVVALCLLVLGACNNEKESKKNEKDVVATVNGVDIPRSEYDVLLEETKSTYALQGMTDENMDDETKKKMESQVLDQLINTELLYQQANKDKIKVEQKEVDTRFDEVKGQFDDEKKFKEALEKNKLTEDTLKERIEKDLLITKYIDTNLGEISVTDAEIQANYDKYKESLEAQEQEAAPLEEVKDQIKAQALSQKEQDKIALILQGLRGNSEIKTF